MRRWAIICALLLAGPAWAGGEFLYGAEGGGESGQSWAAGTFSKAFTSVTGTPTLETSSGLVGLDAGNDYVWRINPASGASEYMATSVSAGREKSIHMEFCLRAAPLPTTRREVLTAYSSAAGGRQCFLVLEGARLRSYFGTTGGECVGSLNDGTPCTDASVCREVNPGAAACGASWFAQSQAMTVGTCYEVVLTNDTDLASPGAAQCALYVDGVLRGGQTRPQGACSGGLHPGDACATDADCSASSEGDGLGTCAVTTIGNVSEIRWGTADTGTGALDYSIDNLAVENGINTNFFFRLVDLHPNGTAAEGAVDTSGCGGASNNHQCVDDTASGTTGHTGETDYVQIQGTNVDRYALTTVTLNDHCTGDGAPDACCSGTDAGTCETLRSDAMIGVSASLRETAANGNTGKLVRLGVSNGTNTLNGTAFETGNIYGTTYRSSPVSLFTTDPAGGALSTADIDALQFVLEHTGTNAVGQRVRVTDVWAEVEVSKAPPPAPPDILSDYTGDGEISVGVIGTSLMNEPTIYTTLAGSLEQVDNLYDYGKEGSKLGQLLPCLSDVLAGGQGCWSQEVAKGEAGHRLDYVLILMGENDLSFSVGRYMPREGFCWMPPTPTPPGPTPTPGGPQHGDPCLLPDGHYSSGWYHRYCTNPEKFGTDCQTLFGDSGETVCGGEADNPTPPCILEGAPAGNDCTPGRLHSPQCVGGICTARTKMSGHNDTFGRVLDMLADARATHGTRPILLLPYRPQEADADEDDSYNCRFTEVRDELWARRAWMQRQAEERGWMSIDLDGQLLANCDGGRVECCLRDALHLSGAITGEGSPATQFSAICPDPASTTGGEQVAFAIEDCLEGAENPNVDCGDL